MQEFGFLLYVRGLPSAYDRPSLFIRSASFCMREAFLLRAVGLPSEKKHTMSVEQVRGNGEFGLPSLITLHPSLFRPLRYTSRGKCTSKTALSTSARPPPSISPNASARRCTSMTRPCCGRGLTS